ncbi:hypothetical protein MPTK1_5g08040 [Marchantia polymorpha subsp. ruderalis]|uniref:Uncharacterized protein n=2 Tax=Marchantia polymorpha TaxID=3197 RepID=A0AAF6BG37_MARPO|nr:hypothetical protein MARPO_0086s0008 [Marchantia polymorpha]BBN10971.1 hypothetical protein Mp_5g08040 [Marchantia polymorpha subsp. ruderalis]|eukprot:PTQ33669.1 hypothetical protein MARPO_0086s0008 [Marchantia polymorpha]
MPSTSPPSPNPCTALRPPTPTLTPRPARPNALRHSQALLLGFHEHRRRNAPVLDEALLPPLGPRSHPRLPANANTRDRPAPAPRPLSPARSHAGPPLAPLFSQRFRLANVVLFPLYTHIVVEPLASRPTIRTLLFLPHLAAPLRSRPSFSSRPLPRCHISSRRIASTFLQSSSSSEPGEESGPSLLLDRSTDGANHWQAGRQAGRARDTAGERATERWNDARFFHLLFAILFFHESCQ